MTQEERDALKRAQQAITPQRADEILAVMNWEHGGCLMGEPCPFPRVTPDEDRVIRALWDSIPNGSSSWMTALYRLCNADR